jgi:hypothetical protein
MSAVAAAGAGFLIAVLWFDLMFDVQTRGYAGEILPDEVLASIGAYYRRVTTEASPMSRLIPVVMFATVIAIGAEIRNGAAPRWAGWASLALAVSAIGLAMARTVRNAMRLGAAVDSPTVRTSLARAVYRDHLYCFVAMSLVVGLQLIVALK